jgi:CRP-like cAMP-binding protein
MVPQDRDARDAVEQVRLHKDRAVELVARGHLDEAVAEYLAALEVAPADVFARQRAAEILARLGRNDEAVEQYLCLVGKYAAEGRLLRAIATCQLILQLDPTQAETLSVLSDLYAKRDSSAMPAAVRIPSAMAGALKRPSASPPFVDPQSLARIPLFSDLEGEAFASMARRFERVVAKSGATLVEEGQPGDAMFAVSQGLVRVERRDHDGAVRAIAEMGEGEFFGEMSLLSRCPRFASVTAVTECELLKLKRADLAELVATSPRIGEIVNRFYKERLLANVLRASAIFRDLPKASHASLANVFTLEAHPAGRVLIEEGKPGGDGMFVLLRGKCDVFHRARGAGKGGTSDQVPYPPLGEGDVFGEVSLLQGGPFTASVRTATPCVVLGLDREWVDELLLSHPPVRDALYAVASSRLERTHELLAKELLDERLV